MNGTAAPRIVAFFLKTIIVGFVLTPSVPAQAQPASVPFVVGFERFARSPANQVHQIDGGRLLLTELSCTACHLSMSPEFQPKRGPVLNGTGDRIDGEWIAKFLDQPQSVKPGATMPAMLEHMSAAEKQQTIKLLTTYLGSLHDGRQFEFSTSATNPVPVQFWRKGDAERGRKLFHQIGCVACHEPDPDFETEHNYKTDLEKQIAELNLSPEEVKELGLDRQDSPIPSIPLGQLEAKYSRQALSFFLLDPVKHRPAGRMPNMKLKHEPAADLAAWLLRRQQPPVFEFTKDPNLSSKDVAAGRRLFEQLGCANCHQAEDLKPQKVKPLLTELRIASTASCLSGTHGAVYPLDAAQKAAIGKTLQSLKQPQQAPDKSGSVKVDQATWSLLQFNCYACHERQGRGGVGPNRVRFFETAGRIDIGDEGRLPPSLTHVGSKLKSDWLKKVLDGTGDVRPHMLARMPVFGPKASREISEQINTSDRADQFEPIPRMPKQPTDPGRVIVGTGCIQCHSLRDESMPGVLGIDLAVSAQRLRPEWFRAFLLDPASLKDRTRMPTFFPGGRTSFREMLEGDPEKQIASMWRYLQEVKDLELPEKLLASRVNNFNLAPSERPMVLRTFMDGVGTHALAVGFPEKIHFAFDAETCEVRRIWRGDFLNAHGTWFDRFTPPARPLGSPVVTPNDGHVLAVLKSASDPWPAPKDRRTLFRGYQLDKDRIPTLRYELDDLEVSEVLKPLSDGAGLVRTIAIRQRGKTADTDGELCIEPLNGESLKLLSRTRCETPDGLRVEVSGVEIASSALIESGSKRADGWRVVLKNELPADITLTYQLTTTDKGQDE